MQHLQPLYSIQIQLNSEILHVPGCRQVNGRNTDWGGEDDADSKDKIEQR